MHRRSTSSGRTSKPPRSSPRPPRYRREAIAKVSTKVTRSEQAGARVCMLMRVRTCARVAFALWRQCRRLSHECVRARAGRARSRTYRDAQRVSSCGTQTCARRFRTSVPSPACRRRVEAEALPPGVRRLAHARARAHATRAPRARAPRAAPPPRGGPQRRRAISPSTPLQRLPPPHTSAPRVAPPIGDPAPPLQAPQRILLIHKPECASAPAKIKTKQNHQRKTHRIRIGESRVPFDVR